MKKITIILLLLILAIPLLLGVIDFIRYPECYISTWKYQLQNDIAAGDKLAVAYYENTYLASGRILFEKGGVE